LFKVKGKKKGLMSDVDLLKNVLELYSMWSYHLYGNTIPKLFQCDPPDVSNQLLPGIYRPETGQLVCPDHPCWKIGNVVIVYDGMEWKG
jgi:hypothetical protein